MKHIAKILALVIPFLAGLIGYCEDGPINSKIVYPSDLLATLKHDNIIIEKNSRVCENIGEQTESLIISRRYTGYINVTYTKIIKDCENPDKYRSFLVKQRTYVEKCYCGEDTHDMVFSILYDIKKKSEKKRVAQNDVNFTYYARSSDILSDVGFSYHSAGRLVTFENLVNRLLHFCENSIEVTEAKKASAIDTLLVK